jgi:hypothetical protein
MSKARADLFSRLNSLRYCLTESVLVDGAPTDRRKNEVAVMYRNGLAVLAFAIMEAYIRDRTTEVLSSFNNTVRFADLSDKLQFATTVGALKAVLFRLNLVDKADQVTWTLSQVPAIANAATNVSTLSAFSFGQSKSNISGDDVSEILNAFGIDGGWTAISAIAKRVGIGGVADYCQSFKNLADRRHSAAHDITANIPLNDLNNSITEIIGICCSFDLLLSHSLSLHNLNQIPNRARGRVENGHIKLRFISAHPSRANFFREQVEVKGGLDNPHTVKNHPTLAAAETAALINSKVHRQQLVFLDSKALPEKWSTW